VSVATITRLRRIATFLLLGMGISTVNLSAENTRFWREGDSVAFGRGTSHSVALRSDGKLTAAPHLEQIGDPNMSYLFALQEDSHGNLFAAGGSNAKVTRLDPHGHETVVFQSPELVAEALVIDRYDNIYVGTAPDGKVYKVTPQGSSTVFFDPERKYIWALAMSRDGVLFVATGDKGEIFAVAPDGQGRVFYSSEDRHVRSLAFDGQSNLLLGTEPKGLLTRVKIEEANPNTPPHAGSAFVLLQTAGKELTSLSVGQGGTIYATSIGTGLGSASHASSGTLTPMGTGAFLTATGGSVVYRITPDGSVTQLWSSQEDLAYSSSLSGDGTLLVGLGTRGEVIEIDTNSAFSMVATTNAGQVTAMATHGDRVYLATANPGKVFSLSGGADPEATFESDTFDARILSRWGRITWFAEEGEDGALEMFVRCGNTSDPQKNWTPWMGPYTNGASVGCPITRFAQWKAMFHTSTQHAPKIDWVTLAYLPNNVAPVIEEIVMQNPGVQLQGIATGVFGGAEHAVVRMPASHQLSSSPLSSGGGDSASDAPQASARRGYQSVIWSTHDDNNDELVFSIYYQAEGERDWKLLKSELTQHFYSWDTTGMPDGTYRVKVVASDSPSNPPENALTTECISSRFDIDNTPPSISSIKIVESDAGARLRFHAEDSHSTLSRAEFSFDSGRWTLIFPVGFLADSSRENYDVLIGGITAGDHVVVVRVFDEFGNVAASKTIFTTGTAVAQSAGKHP
jgi:hypothetical protein